MLSCASLPLLPSSKVISPLLLDKHCVSSQQRQQTDPGIEGKFYGESSCFAGETGPKAKQ